MGGGAINEASSNSPVARRTASRDTDQFFYLFIYL